MTTVTTVTRKAFLGDLAGGMVLLVIGGCGGGGGYSAAPAPAAAGCAATISGNHGHALSIPAADLDATAPRTYDIQGSADHTHQVTFSAADLAQLKAGQTVTVISTTALAHEHSISETCT